MKKLIATIIFLLIISHTLVMAQSKAKFPEGWEPTKASDYLTEDLSLYNNLVPNHIESDFNGDNIKDQAWILINTSQKAFGLFVFIGKGNDRFKIMILDKHKNNGTDKLSMGISIIEPGQYKTACGKGYWKCEEKEPEFLRLNFSGINYFAFESANSVFFWDSSKKEFTRIWMSD